MARREGSVENTEGGGKLIQRTRDETSDSHSFLLDFLLTLLMIVIVSVSSRKTYKVEIENQKSPVITNH